MAGGVADHTTGGHSATGARKAEVALTLSRLRKLSTAAIVALVAAIALTTFASPGTGDGCPLGPQCLIVHATLFTLLGVAIAGRYAASDAARRSPRRVLAMTVLALWVLAATNELAQDLVRGRGAELGDWLADMAGAVAGMLAGSFVLRHALRASRR